MTSLFIILGLFGSTGYRVYSIQETFVRHTLQKSAYYASYIKADVIIEGSYDPILHPYHLLAGTCSSPQAFTTLVFFSPNTGRTVDHDGTGNGGVASEKERQDSYVLHLLTQNVLWDFVLLLSVMIAIEAIGQRLIYIVLFAGILGFSISDITGATVGLLAGVFAVAICRWKLPKDNTIARFWNSLWI